MSCEYCHSTSDNIINYWTSLMFLSINTTAIFIVIHVYCRVVIVGQLCHLTPVGCSCTLSISSVFPLEGCISPKGKIYITAFLGAKQKWPFKVNFGYITNYTCVERKTGRVLTNKNYTQNSTHQIWKTRAPPNWLQYPLPTSHHHQWFVVQGWLGNPPNQDLNVSQSWMERMRIDASKVVGNWRNKIWKDTSHEAKLCCPSFGVSTANFPFPAFGHVGNCAGSWKSQPLQVILLLQPIVDDVSVNDYVPWKTTSSNWVWEFSIHILS